MDPLNVLQVIKKNLGELKAYIRTVSSGDDMASTTFETSEKNSSLNEVHQALVNMKEQFNAKLIYNDDTLNSTALIEKIKTSLTSLPQTEENKELLDTLTSQVTSLDEELTAQDDVRRADLQNLIVRLELFDDQYFLKLD